MYVISIHSIYTHNLFIMMLILRAYSLVNACLLDTESFAFWFLFLMVDGLEYLEVCHFYVVVFKHSCS